jgi:hypothetical protein
MFQHHCHSKIVAFLVVFEGLLSPMAPFCLFLDNKQVLVIHIHLPLGRLGSMPTFC